MKARRMSGPGHFTRTALTISLFLSLHSSAASGDITGCCTRLSIQSKGESINHQSNRVGTYSISGVFNERPIYKNDDREEFLFYLRRKTKGLWMVGPKVAEFNGGLAHRGDTICAEDVAEQQWKYTDGSAWHVDPLLTITCLDKKATPKCTYSDGVQFVGGDLPEEFGGGGLETSMNSTADCIAECESREGCLYWTWVQKEGTNCYLKMDRIESVRRPKYVSGSIPSVCYHSGLSVADQPEQPADDDSDNESVCTYKSIDFVGGDLSSTAATTVAECRQHCSEEPACKLFTVSKSGCHLKTESVKARVDENVVSGAGSDICQDFVSPHVPSSAKKSSPTYDVNEINGKFKIMMKFTDELKDSNSQQFKKLAADLEENLKDMLDKSELSEQATFNVNVESFRPGSVVCNFRVNYILKEAYLALPFAIKPNNVTDTMNKNFKFKKGILFQKFLIVGGSFKSSSPVDHCAAKGCSHKCNYDYDIEDYVCTCPPTLTLNTDQKTCVDPTNAAEFDTVAEEATMKPEISVSVLPTDCIWTAWSEWSDCLCGVNTSKRSRTMQVPAKNGGACSGEYEQVMECDTVACDGSDVFIEVPENAEDRSTVDDSVTTEPPAQVITTVDTETQSNSDVDATTINSDELETVTQITVEVATDVDIEQSTSESTEAPSTDDVSTEVVSTVNSLDIMETTTVVEDAETKAETETNTELLDAATTEVPLEDDNNNTTAAEEHEDDSTTAASIEFGDKISEDTTVSAEEQIYDDDADSDIDEDDIMPITTVNSRILEEQDKVFTTTEENEQAGVDMTTVASIEAITAEEVDKGVVQVTTEPVSVTETSTNVVDTEDAAQMDEVTTAEANTEVSTTDGEIEVQTEIVAKIAEATEANTETTTVEADMVSELMPKEKESTMVMSEEPTEVSEQITTTVANTITEKTIDEESTETMETIDTVRSTTEAQLVDATTSLLDEETTTLKTEGMPLQEGTAGESITTEEPIMVTITTSADVISAVTDTVYPTTVTDGAVIYDDDTDDDGEPANPDEATTSPSVQESQTVTDAQIANTDSTADETTVSAELSGEMETTTINIPSQPDISETSSVDESTSEAMLLTTTMSPSVDDATTTIATDGSDVGQDNDNNVSFPDEEDMEFSTTLRPESDINFPTEKLAILPNPTTQSSVEEEVVTSTVEEFTGANLPDPVILSQTKEQSQETTTETAAVSDEGEVSPLSDSVEGSTMRDEEEATTRQTELQSPTEPVEQTSIMTSQDTEVSTDDIQQMSTTEEADQEENIVTASPRFFTNDADSDGPTDSATSTTVTNKSTGQTVDSEVTTIPNDLEATTITPTTVTIVAVQHSEDATVVITTLRPDTHMDDTTTHPPTEDTEAHEFDCVEVDGTDFDATPDQIPMQCTQMDGVEEKKRRIYLLINKSQVDEHQLFAKNVKVVVKDLMIMDISNQAEVR